MLRETGIDAYIPIRRMSPLVHPSDDWLVCVIKAYLDGSYSDGLVGLAAYVAPEHAWATLERELGGLLDHLKMTHVHMKDLYQRRDAFKGKDQTQALNAAADIVAYLAGLHEWSFRRYSCVIRKDDYHRAARVVTHLQDKAVHALCVDNCVGRVFTPRFRERGDDQRNIEILFDGAEKFFEHIHRVWKVEKDDETSWAQYVFSVTEVCDTERKLRPLQVADVLAWVARRYRAKGDHRDWHEALCGRQRSQFNCHEFYDYDALVSEYGSRPE